MLPTCSFSRFASSAASVSSRDCRSLMSRTTCAMHADKTFLRKSRTQSELIITCRSFHSQQLASGMLTCSCRVACRLCSASAAFSLYAAVSSSCSACARASSAANCRAEQVGPEVFVLEKRGGWRRHGTLQPTAAVAAPAAAAVAAAAECPPARSALPRACRPPQHAAASHSPAAAQMPPCPAARSAPAAGAARHIRAWRAGLG